MSTITYTETLELAGRIIMENGGETYRVEETVTRMGTAFGLEHVGTFAVPSGVFISFRCNGKTEAAIIRVRRKGTNFDRVNTVNEVSRMVERGEMDLPAAYARLREVENSPAMLTPLLQLLFVGISSAGFAVMFGGSMIDFAVAFVVGAFVQALSNGLDKLQLSGYAATMIGGFFTALLPMAFHGLTGLGLPASSIAGAMMPLVPGVAMTNAVQDTLRGDLLSGVAHIVQAVLTATLIAVGAIFGTSLFQLLGGVV